MKSRLLLAFCFGCALNLHAAADAPAAPYILTPPAPATPRINGPDVFGVRPGSPFLYTIPATGDRPMTFSAKNLPRGLKLDSQDRPHHRLIGKDHADACKCKGGYCFPIRIGRIPCRDAGRAKFARLGGEKIPHRRSATRLR